MKRKVAICLFGVSRSAERTLGSLQLKVIRPASSLGEVHVFGHLFYEERLKNPRSKEDGIQKDPREYFPKYIDLAIDAPNDPPLLENSAVLLKYGDEFEDGGQSIRNLVHQLVSLEKVTKRALAIEPTFTIFCRPDLFYHNSFLPYYRRTRLLPYSHCFLPAWQQWKNGYNDRMAICRGKSAAEAFGQRLTFADEYCRSTRGPLHSERLLRFCMEKARVPVYSMKCYASRVRIGGVFHGEDFDDQRSSWYQHY